MKTENGNLQILRDLITIVTRKASLKLLYDELQGELEPRDIAHTILELTDSCPLCDDRKLVSDTYCPSCMGDQSRFKANRIDRYRLLLEKAPEILRQVLRKGETTMNNIRDE